MKLLDRIFPNRNAPTGLRYGTSQSSSEVVALPDASILEKVLITGDLASLSPPARLDYYTAVCRSIRINPLTKPFDYIELDGKLTLYARKDCTDQLRKLYGISVTILSRDITSDVFCVTSRAYHPNGRQDESLGAVAIKGLFGKNLADAMMKAETKAKRRVTLSICGLGIFDETEIQEMSPTSPAETATEAERRVKQANENREIDAPINVTNFGEIVCHIGKPSGELLGKKISEIHPRLLEWLRDHYGEGEGKRWGDPPSEKDKRLKEAVDLALDKLSE